MNARWLCLSWVVIVSIAAVTQGCTPQLASGEGKAVQPAEGDDDGDEDANEGEDPNTPDPGEGGCGEPDTKVCEGFAVGDGTTCLTTAELQSSVDAACAEHGLIAVEIYVAFDCPDNASSYAKVLCCNEGEPATVPTEPPPPGDPGEPSAGGAIGDGTTCIPNSDLQQQAEDACSALGMTLVEVYTANDCPDDASHYAKYLCGP